MTSKSLGTLLGCGLCVSDQGRAGSTSGNPEAGDRVPEMRVCSGMDALVKFLLDGSYSYQPLLAYTDLGPIKPIHQAFFGRQWESQIR